ncbi:MAG TPA: hypothetical protein VKZ60_07700, partial [Chloroflexota bacterium]|nr:hypothetical protein [Chloroflexota bacterium]
MAIDEEVAPHEHQRRTGPARRLVPAQSRCAPPHESQALQAFERAARRLSRATSAAAALERLAVESARLGRAERAEVWLRQDAERLYCRVTWPPAPPPGAVRGLDSWPHATEAITQCRAVWAGEQRAGTPTGEYGTWLVPLVAADRWLGLLCITRAASTPALGPLLLALAAQVATLVQARRDARALAHRYGLLVNVAAHDLRNVTTSLKGYAHLIERHLAQQPDERPRRWAAVVHQQVNTLVDLLAGLVEVGRVTSGRRALELERLDLRVVVQQAVAELDGAAPRLQLPGAPTDGEWDAARLSRALTAALHSALRGTTDHAILRLEATPEGPVLELVPGTSDEAPAEATAWSDTADLELHVARALVEAHGGRMACWPTGSG